MARGGGGRLGRRGGARQGWRPILAHALGFGLLLLACDSSGPTATDASSPGMDASLRVDAGNSPCSSEAECDDGIACTSDHCDRITMLCRSEPLDLNCDSGFVCDVVRGCVRPDVPDAGMCAGLGGSCASDPDCCDGLSCGSGACLCWSAGTAASGRFCNGCCAGRCQGGECAEGVEGRPCNDAGDCQGDMECEEGVCREPACPPGLVDCNGDPADGCEASLSSRATCGSCDNSCSGGGFHWTMDCNEGACEPSCDSGWADCNSDLTDGCETDISGGDRCGCAMVGSCRRESDCCSGICNEGLCCGRTGDYCASSVDCCLVDHICRGNRCCRTHDARCSSNSDCCSGLCSAGRCSF